MCLCGGCDDCLKDQGIKEEDFSNKELQDLQENIDEMLDKLKEGEIDE